MITYYLDRYKTQVMRDKAFDDFLPALKFVPDWFATSKMIKKLHNDLFEEGDIIFFDEDSSNVTFFSDEMVFLVFLVFLIINLDGTNYDEDDPETIIHARFMFGKTT